MYPFRFQDAHRYILRSLDRTDDPDPVILDHLGDILWRLGRKPEAETAWRRAAKEAEVAPLPLPELDLVKRLAAKLDAAQRGVAPPLARAGDEIAPQGDPGE